MPPSTRKPAAKKPDEAKQADADICRLCWPNGWPSDDTPNATCEHGVWTR